MTSTRSSSRKGSSPTAQLSRIPVLKGSKASAKGTTTTTTTTRQRRKVAVVSDSTRVLRSSIGHTPTGANKENIPFFPRRRFLSRANLTSPTRMRRDGSGKKPFGRPSKVQRPKRQPLRELTEAEIFERDEAVMGDLRRRRASGDNYIVESSIEVTFDSSLAQDSTVQGAMPSDPEQSAPVEPESPLIVLRPAIEKFQVLRTTDSEEKLQSGGVVNTIIAAAATAASTSIDYENRPMTRAALAQKQQHPSIRTSLSSIENNSPDVMLRSAEATPINPLRARATRFSSPCSGTMVHAGVSKAQASPSPLKVSRKGLGTKSTNTVMKKVLEEGGKLEGSKFVMKDTTTTSKTAAKKRTVTTTTTTMKEPKATARKASSSLKRAAGVNTTVSTSARAGLANIGRMR